MALTPRGIYYPDPSGVPKRQDLQDMATTADTALGTALPSIWQSYSPSLGGLVLGNGTMTARYVRTGTLARGLVKLVMGSTTTYSGTYLIGLPLPVAAPWDSNFPVGRAFFLDSSAGSASRTAGVAVTVDANRVFLVGTNTGSTITNAVPWTWAVGDILSFGFEYEISA